MLHNSYLIKYNYSKYSWQRNIFQSSSLNIYQIMNSRYQINAWHVLCVSRSIQNINSVQLLIALFYQEQILYNTLPKNHDNLRIILEGQGDYVVTLRVNSTPVNPIPTNPLRIREKTWPHT